MSVWQRIIFWFFVADRFENALRQMIPTATLPYWDCTLDQPLSHPSESVIWSDLFLGNGDGEVNTGPFRGWNTQFGFGLLHRQVSSLRHLMSVHDLRNILEEDFLGNISYPDTKSSKNLEQLHNNVHVWVGGLMRKIEIGAFDPVFYVLHTFIDKVWEDFRVHQRSKEIDPTKDYPEFYGRRNHASFAPMGLGNLVVIDGISDVWNKNVVYRQPSCGNSGQNECGSKFLRCDHSTWTCVSKTKDEVTKSINKDKHKDTTLSRTLNSGLKELDNLYIPSLLNSGISHSVYSDFLYPFKDRQSTAMYSENVSQSSALQKAKEIYMSHLN